VLTAPAHWFSWPASVSCTVTLASKQIPKKVTPLKRNSNLLKPVLRIIEPYFFYAIPH
jgi:hypothetical protein